MVRVIASTKDVSVYCIEGEEMTYALQFHQEVYHTTDGKQLLKTFGPYCQE
jgi:GMP synthase (glutamine-hydrolysing)